MTKSTALTPELIGSTREEWQAIIGEEEFAVRFARFFELDLPRSRELIIAVICSGSSGADALVEIISSPKTLKTKLMNVVLRPDYTNLESQTIPPQVLEVYFEAVKATFGTAIDHEAEQVKLYGRTNDLFEMLKKISELLDIAPLDGYIHKIEGRWLTFHKSSSRLGL